ncbi:kinesin-like protein [Vairimorpha necatrix]|uniref:Kinesin-like protein n=1 Tax=Vairimorpha necatrix TaxID=6039 RepID=A0AAX4JDX3_9MICR
MTSKNMEIYFKCIEDSLNNLQEDFNFLYETASKNPILEKTDKKDLLEEIEFLKNKIITIENNKNFMIKNEIESKIIQDNSLYIQEIEFLKAELEKIKNEKKLHLLKIKNLQNEIIDLKGSIRVFLRIRRTDNQSDIEICNEQIQIPYNNKFLKFNFDRIFTPNENQDDIFKEFYSVIESVYDGYKICIFAYGQTGSGKTFTMLGTKEQPGIIYKSLDMIYSLKNMTNEEITVKFSSIEIYNEEVRDLINKESKQREYIELKNLYEACDVINKTLNNRITGKTNCNEHSSRSHLICNLKIEIKNHNEIRSGDLCFIDLAGSERLNNSKVEGIRLKETQNINKSLSSLGDVFMSILRKDSHVPYRNSKLTHTLQEYFTGKSRVAMILNINGDINQRNETISTLRFGAKVSECKLGKVEKNIIKKI